MGCHVLLRHVYLEKFRNREEFQTKSHVELGYHMMSQ